MDGRIMTEVTTVKRSKTLLTAFIVIVIVIAINHVVFSTDSTFVRSRNFVVRTQQQSPSIDANLAYDSQFLILAQQLRRYFPMLYPTI